MKYINIYITFSSQKEAKTITNHLLRQKLIACATFYPIKSHYRWQNKIIKTKEIASLITTKAVNWNKILKIVKKMHSYQVPCIKKEKFSANKEYEDWVKAVTTK